MYQGNEQHVTVHIHQEKRTGAGIGCGWLPYLIGGTFILGIFAQMFQVLFLVLQTSAGLITIGIIIAGIIIALAIRYMPRKGLTKQELDRIACMDEPISPAQRGSLIVRERTDEYR